MKLLSFRVDEEPRLGLLVGSSVVDVNKGYYNLFGDHVPSDMLSFLEMGDDAMAKARMLEDASKIDLEELRSTSGIVFDALSVDILAPIPKTTRHIICLGLNYRKHIQEVGLSLPNYPVFFTKPSTSIVGPDAPILFPKSTNKVDYEAELAFIFGKRGKDVPEEDAYDYVAGYTIFNDVTARDLQKRHGQWFKGKGLDTFAPMGPYLVTGDEIQDPHNLEISLELNGSLMQKANTSDMVFKIPALIKFITMDMTVEPGDIVATGTPSGVGYTRNPPVYLKPGDIMKIYIENVGVLRNNVLIQ